MIAHIGGVPLEEGLPFVSGAGTGLLLVARAWIGLRLRRRRQPRPDEGSMRCRPTSRITATTG
jgi:hypothetical protein